MMDFKTGQQIHHQKRSFGAGTKADRPTVTASAKKSFLFNPFIAGVVHSSLHSRAWLALSLGMGILGATIGHLPAYAEGSYQIGVSDGNDPSEQSRGSIRQAIFEYDSPFNNPGTTGLTPAINRPIFVDVLAGEVINVSACGNDFGDDWEVDIYYIGSDLADNNTTRTGYGSPSGTLVFGQAGDAANTDDNFRGQGTFGTNGTNGGCTAYSVLSNTSMDNITPTGSKASDGSIVKHTAASTGVYEIRIRNRTQNNNDNNSVVKQFDISITPNTSTLPNPQVNAGRVWSFLWGINADGFSQSESTDANFYIKVPGGFPNTNYVWKLDLNDFAGFVYELTANERGVDSPNSLNRPVAGLSVTIADNNVSPQYRQYLSYPTQNVFSEPTANAVTVEEFRFIDSAGVDNTISPAPTTVGTQDTGEFRFKTNSDGTYVIVIDIDNDANTANGFNPDGIYGVGDVSLRGETTSSGEVQISWDGKTNLGTAVTTGTYLARLQAIVGEYHFIAGDVENSGPTSRGLKIEKAASQTSSTPSAVYWDDQTGLNNPSGATVSGSLVDPSITGEDHQWGTTGSGGIFGDNRNAFGNVRFLDTYVYGQFTVSETPVIIIDATTSNPDDPRQDYGDAPDTYSTNKTPSNDGVSNLDDVGASHSLGLSTPTVYLGATPPDGESDATVAVSGADAVGDDTSGSTPDDETGVSSFPALQTTDTNYSVTVNLLNNSGGDAYLVGWIDFNRNGKFEANEGLRQTITTNASAQAIALNWTGLGTLGLVSGDTYARFRLSTDTGLDTNDFIGAFIDGEVEDYRLTITAFDYGDAPDTDTASGTGTGNYQTLLSDDGARHTIVTGLSLGSAIDPDNGTLQNLDATADDSNNTGSADDEEAIDSFPSLTLPMVGQTYTVPVKVTNNTGSAAFLVGYIDFNKDGDFLDTGEESSPVTVLTGTTPASPVNVSFTVPPGITTGSTFVRFRLATLQTNVEEAFGLATSGEVEDYQLTIGAGTPDLLLVKRITRLIPEDGVADVPYINFVNDGEDRKGDSTIDNNDPGWPSATYPSGVITVAASPGDTIEYTVYFLNTGDAAASNVQICDALDEYLTYLPDTYASGTFPPFITPGAGIELNFNGSSGNDRYLTGVNDGDQGEFVDAGIVSGCQYDPPGAPITLVPLPNPNGTVKVDLTSNISASTGSGAPSDSYGFIRFRTLVK